jgi:hypothetical protein
MFFILVCFSLVLPASLRGNCLGAVLYSFVDSAGQCFARFLTKRHGLMAMSALTLQELYSGGLMSCLLILLSVGIGSLAMTLWSICLLTLLVKTHILVLSSVAMGVGRGHTWTRLRVCCNPSSIAGIIKSWGPFLSSCAIRAAVASFAPCRLELLGVSMGLSTFEEQLKGRRVVIHCDNKGAEACLSVPHCICCFACFIQESIRRGSSRSWDHAQLVHEQWLHAAVISTNLFVKRVDTRVNIADLPSRRASLVFSFPALCCLLSVPEDFRLLRQLNMKEVLGKLHDVYSLEDPWNVLQERWAL